MSNSKSEHPFYFKDGSIWYAGPTLFCKTQERWYGHVECRPILLPFPTLPFMDEDLRLIIEEKYADWPPEDWDKTFLCRDCGYLYNYSGFEIEWSRVSKSSEGKYRNDSNCFAVEVKCAHRGCDAPIKFYVDMQDRTKADLELELKRGFAGDWPACGHPACPHPFAPCRIEPLYLGPI